MCQTLLSRYLSHQCCDIVLLQDISDSLKSDIGGFAGYTVFLPTHHTTLDYRRGPLVAVLVRQGLCARLISFSNDRMCGVFLKTPLGIIACISAYIHYRHGVGLDLLSIMISKVRQETPYFIIGSDVNGHSRWWGPPDQISNDTGELVEDFIISQNLIIENTWPSPPTFSSELGFETWVDVTLTSSRLHDFIQSWQVLDEEDLASDHMAILTTFEASVRPSDDFTSRLNWRSVCWTSFRLALQWQLQSSFPKDLPSISSSDDLNQFVTTLSSALQRVIDDNVPTRRFHWPANPWWSSDLEALHRELTRLRRRWKRTRDRQDRCALNAFRRRFQQEISEAKRRSWRQFCEQTSDSDLWSSYQKLLRHHRSRDIRPLQIDDH